MGLDPSVINEELVAGSSEKEDSDESEDEKVTAEDFADINEVSDVAFIAS